MEHIWCGMQSLSDKSRVTNKNRNEKAGQDELAFANERRVGAECRERREKEQAKERGNILQEKARPCRELADEYLLESTKD